MTEKKRTMMPNVEQMKAAAAMATDPAVDPVVLATALGLILTGRGMLPEAYALSQIGDRLIRANGEDN
jgi:hypothetical protein